MSAREPDWGAPVARQRWLQDMTNGACSPTVE